MTTKILFPTSEPRLNLDFANTKALDSRISFSRASTGTYVGADGLIKTAPIGVPRFNHDPATGESLGLLVEEQRTNSLTYSSNFTNGVWGLNGCSVTANATIAPDGTLTGTQLTSTIAAGTGAVNIGQLYNQQNDGNPKSSSIFVKQGTYRYARLSPTISSNAATSILLDLQTGTITLNSGGPPYGYSVTSYPNGWFRIVANFNGGVPQQHFALFLTDYIGGADSGSGTSAGNPAIGQYIYIWGAQYEFNVGTTSYIPTVASTVTRSGDVATMSGSNFNTWFNASEGSWISNARVQPGAYGPAGMIGALGNGVYAQGAGGYGILTTGFFGSNLWQTSGRSWSNGAQVGAPGSINFAGISEPRRSGYFTWNSSQSGWGINGQISSKNVTADVFNVMKFMNRFVIAGEGIDSYYTAGTSTSISRITFYPTSYSDTQLQALAR